MKKIYFILLLILFTSCSQTKYIESTHLFSLGLGNLYNQLNYFSSSLYPISKLGNIFLSDSGNFYITDPNNKRVLFLNNFGQPLSIIYNPIETSANALKEEAIPTSVITKTWNLKTISNIIVNNKIYTLETGDINNTTVKGSIINVFSLEGDHLYSIGTEGKNSKPFTHITIDYLFTAKGNSIVVRANDGNQLILYWFSNTGELINKQKVLRDNENTKEKSIKHIINIWPIYNENSNFISEEITYKQPSSTKVESTNHAVFLYKDKFKKKLFSIKDESDFSINIIGLIRNNKIIAIQYNSPKSYILYSFKMNGKGKRKIKISFPYNGIPYKFDLNREGLFTGIFYNQHQADIVWWRTDKIL